jgi:hypothetical protein
MGLGFPEHGRGRSGDLATFTDAPLRYEIAAQAPSPSPDHFGDNQSSPEPVVSTGDVGGDGADCCDSGC